MLASVLVALWERADEPHLCALFLEPNFGVHDFQVFERVVKEDAYTPRRQATSLRRHFAILRCGVAADMTMTL